MITLVVLCEKCHLQLVACIAGQNKDEGKRVHPKGKGPRGVVLPFFFLPLAWWTSVDLFFVVMVHATPVSTGLNFNFHHL